MSLQCPDAWEVPGKQGHFSFQYHVATVLQLLRQQLVQQPGLPLILSAASVGAGAKQSRPDKGWF